MYFQDIMKIVLGSVIAIIVAILYFIYFDSKDIIFNNSSVPIKIIVILLPILLIVNVILSFIFKDPKRGGEEEEAKSKNISTLHMIASIIAAAVACFRSGVILFN